MLIATKYHNIANTKYNRSIVHISMYNNNNNNNNAQTAAPAFSIAAHNSNAHR